METLTDRITRYLLARIRRLAILDLYERASVVGLLEADFIVAGDETTGTIWRVPEQSLRLLDANPIRARAEIMRRLGKAPYKTTAIDVLIQDLPGEPPHENVRSAPKGRADRAAAGRLKSGPVVAAKVPKKTPSASSEFLAMLREHIAPPSVAHVAVALLVARAVGSSVPDLSALSAVLRNPGAFVLIKAPVGRFERRFGLMLEDGLILPYWTKLEDVHRSSPLSDGYGDRRRGKTRKTIKTLAGTDVPRAVERSLSRFLVDVLLERSAPVVLADETKTALPPFVSMTPDLLFECGGLDHELMAELLQICCGIPPKQSLRQMEKMALDLEGLSIDALALAVRPGRSLEHILSIFEVLGERARSSDKSDDDDDDDGRGSGRGSDRSGRPKVKSRFLIKDGDDPPKSVDGVDVVQPEKLAETSGKEASGDTAVDPTNPEHSRLRQLRVETLSGYGEARDWALDLKEDLQLWRDGRLPWSEMSTKLILSGPPGTGKTTYARALCNSLQVPLLVTSVASWLEPGYLGDVLKRMSKAFELARENAPVILFVDEIDNIGSRAAGRREQHDDYWRSLINRLLELLDGTAKTDGVIVVAATNLPEKIDPALLRSGRLEKHVAIPMPDTEGLVGILAHHLGADLADVLASAPSSSPKASETVRHHAHNGRDTDVLEKSNRGVSSDA